MEKTKLPTAEEFIKKYEKTLYYNEVPDYLKHVVTIDQAKLALIEFGKLCAKRALEEAADKATPHCMCGGYPECICKEENKPLLATKDSILNAFDLNQIK